LNGNKHIAILLLIWLVPIGFFSGKPLVAQSRKGTKTPKSIKVAFILPFCASQSSPKEKRLWEVSSSYYSGAKWALKSHFFSGVKIDVYAYDNQHDEQRTRDILERPELSTMDLIFGPIGERHYQILSPFCKEYGIALVSPFSEINGPINNPFLLSVVGSNFSKVSNVIEIYEKYFWHKHLLIVDDEASEKQMFMSLLKERLKQKNIPFDWIKFRELSAIDQIVLRHEDPLIFIPSSKKNVVSVSLGKLISLGQNSTILGIEKWARWEGNEYAFWEKLKVHLLASSYVEKEDSFSKKITMEYRQVNRKDMNRYAWAGYDQAQIFLSAFISMGKIFPYYIDEQKFKLSSSCMELVQKNMHLENKPWQLLQFKHNQLKYID